LRSHPRYFFRLHIFGRRDFLRLEGAPTFIIAACGDKFKLQQRFFYYLFAK